MSAHKERAREREPTHCFRFNLAVSLRFIRSFPPHNNERMTTLNNNNNNSNNNTNTNSEAPPHWQQNNATEHHVAPRTATTNNATTTKRKKEDGSTESTGGGGGGGVKKGRMDIDTLLHKIDTNIDEKNTKYLHNIIFIWFISHLCHCTICYDANITLVHKLIKE